MFITNPSGLSSWADPGFVMNTMSTGICDEAESASSQILGTIFLGSAGSAQLLSDWDL